MSVKTGGWSPGTSVTYMARSPQALALQQKLQRERRLASARPALDEVEMVARQTAGEDGIKADDAGQGSGAAACIRRQCCTRCVAHQEDSNVEREEPDSVYSMPRR